MNSKAWEPHSRPPSWQSREQEGIAIAAMDASDLPGHRQGNAQSVPHAFATLAAQLHSCSTCGRGDIPEGRKAGFGMARPIGSSEVENRVSTNRSEGI